MKPLVGRRPSLRRQLAGLLAALALVVAVAQAAFVYVSGERFEESMIDAIALEQLRLSMARYRQDPASAAPNTPDMRLYVSAGADRTSLPEYLRTLPDAGGAYEIFPAPGLEYHVAVGERDGRRFHLVYDVAEHERRQRNLLALLAGSVLAIALLVLAASDRIARRLTDDLERLSSAVREDRGARVPAPLLDLARHAESAELAAALDERRRSLDAALARERAFSASASHELRTPLTQAVTTLDLLESAALDAPQRARVVQLRASLTEITRLTAGLLRAARGTASAAQVRIEAAPLVDEVFGHLRGEARARSIEMRSSIAPGDAMHADRDALWIVLVNVVRNAIRHSRGTRIDVAFDRSTLTVSDDGRGFDASREPFDRTRGEGADPAALGLGLSIVERICEGAGWSFAIDSDPARGTRVSIGFA